MMLPPLPAAISALPAACPTRNTPDRSVSITRSQSSGAVVSAGPSCVTDNLAQTVARPYDFAVIDEAQDLGVAEARFFGIMAGANNDGLFFAGDLGQRIFQQPFSWKALGLDVRGRSFTLRINYRTSHQIRLHADRLLPSTVSDVDGNTEGRRGTVSMFDGPPPIVTACSDVDHECLVVGE